MEYNIQYKGLKEGKHSFVFDINDAFFKIFPESEIEHGKLTAEVELTKRTTGLEVLFTINGTVSVECDRCLDMCDQDVDAENKMFFEFKNESKEVTDELVYISESEDTIDLSKYIYEFIILALPLQRIHGDNEEGESMCNPDMLARLNSMNVNNDDDEIDDPRWDKLRGLIN